MTIYKVTLIRCSSVREARGFGGEVSREPLVELGVDRLLAIAELDQERVRGQCVGQRVGALSRVQQRVCVVGLEDGPMRAAARVTLSRP